MRVLITTSFSVLVLDLDDDRCTRLETGNGLYYGLALRDDHLFVAARRRLVSAETPREAEAGEIRVYDQRLRLCDVWHAPFLLRDLHQIAWCGDQLWMTCAFDNMIAIRHADGTWEQWFPLGEPTQPWRDVNHFNSITVEPDRACVVAHNLAEPSELLFFDRATRQLSHRLELGRAAHDAWRHGDEYRTCSSAEGLLLGSDGFAVETGGFPRGVADVGDAWLIGLSELAERQDRDLTTGQVVVFDRDWVEQRRLRFEREGLILDLLPLPATFGG